MSASNSAGEFHAKKPGSEPITSHGHQTGRINSEADAAPEFNAQTLPAGSAPSTNTFTPHPETAGAAPVENSAEASLGGATSGDVHTGLGHPGAGQSSKELHHDGQSHRVSNRSGLEGMSGANKGNNAGEDTKVDTL